MAAGDAAEKQCAHLRYLEHSSKAKESDDPRQIVSREAMALERRDPRNAGLDPDLLLRVDSARKDDFAHNRAMDVVCKDDAGNLELPNDHDHDSALRLMSISEISGLRLTVEQLRSIDRFRDYNTGYELTSLCVCTFISLLEETPTIRCT